MNKRILLAIIGLVSFSFISGSSGAAETVLGSPRRGSDQSSASTVLTGEEIETKLGAVSSITKLMLVIDGSTRDIDLKDADLSLPLSGTAFIDLICSYLGLKDFAITYMNVMGSRLIVGVGLTVQKTVSLGRDTMFGSLVKRGQRSHGSRVTDESTSGACYASGAGAGISSGRMSRSASWSGTGTPSHFSLCRSPASRETMRQPELTLPAGCSHKMRFYVTNVILMNDAKMTPLSFRNKVTFDIEVKESQNPADAFFGGCAQVFSDALVENLKNEQRSFEKFSKLVGLKYAGGIAACAKNQVLIDKLKTLVIEAFRVEEVGKMKKFERGSFSFPDAPGCYDNLAIDTLFIKCS